MQNSPSRKPIEIKISTVVAVSAILHSADLAVLQAAMVDMTGGMSDFFEDEFTVIDIGTLSDTGSDIQWEALVRLLKSYRLNPVAVRNAPDAMRAAILAQGLSIDHPAAIRGGMPEAEAPIRAAAPVPVAPAPVSFAPPPSSGTMLVDTPVRAGQRIYARGSDLVITAAVNNGAEVIADGSIHVYAPLRGRALAGASGNAEARIFTMSMEAELVSIAGIYRTFENGMQKGLQQQAVQIRSVGDRIDILPLGAAKP